MKEAKIILPDLDNDGQSLESVHDSLAATLCLYFKGCTIVATSGQWVDNTGKLFNETGKAFIVASDETNDNNIYIKLLARLVGNKAKQQAVYYVDFSGNAEIIDLN